MASYDFVTLDVFTDRRFGGNQLAVFPDARGMSDADMQALATEFNLSETTFVLPPDNPAHTAHVRIFNRSAEMPFAGHPNVGTGHVLAGLGRDRDGILLFEELAGLVTVEISRNQAGSITGATIAAPQPLALGMAFSPAQIAACAGIAADQVIITNHEPVQASVGVDFVIAEVTPQALDHAAPNVAGFEAVAAGLENFSMRMSLHLYAHEGDGLRARMFSPLTGTFEDAATGSANATLGALLLSLTDQDAADYHIRQGAEMGRPSFLNVRAHRASDGFRATVGGGCVTMFRGQVEL